MKVALGIDLGTTNSVVCVYRKGKVETIKIGGYNTFPSVVSFKDKGNMLVGQPAKKRLIIDPEHSVGSVKRFMGDRTKRFSIYGKEYTPVDISSFILKEIVAQAEKFLGEKIKDVIITVPAYFNNNQKSDTLAAGKMAGLNVLQLIPEPTSAAIAYGLDKGKDQTIMVYDLGGGTFDVSVLNIAGNNFKVVAVDGDSQLGGDDFDNAIVSYLMDNFKKKNGIDLRKDESKEALITKQKLKEAAERAKFELSQAQGTEILIPEVMGFTIDETLSRAQYNKLIKEYLDTTIEKIRSVLKEASLSPGDINRVILVGGSTRNSAVREIVAREIKEPYTSEKVDEEVARGAAILAASLTLPEEDFTPLTVENVTPHSLGLRVSKGKEIDKFKELIRRQSTVPVKVEEEFTTYRDNQTSVEVAVFQGEEKLCSQNTFVGGFIMEGIPKQQAGKPAITVEFELDSSDILQVHATCDDVSGHVVLNINEAAEDELFSRKAECIVLLIDLSYSMSGWKLETTKTAVKEFLKIKKKAKAGQDLIGCVTFESYAHTVSPLTRDFDDIRRKVNRMEVAGSTNMSGGLNEALSCLEEKEDKKMSDRIILLSDGDPDSESGVRSVLKKLINKNIRVDTVGAGTDYNRRLLAEIAKKTGGQFEAAENIQALMQAFTNLAELN
ncbi:MAG: Hsp70 family protein [bacterium]